MTKFAQKVRPNIENWEDKVMWEAALVGVQFFIGMLGDTVTTQYIRKYPDKLYERNPIQRWFLKKGYFIHEHIIILIAGEIILFILRDNLYVVIGFGILGLLLIMTLINNIYKIFNVREKHSRQFYR